MLKRLTKKRIEQEIARQGSRVAGWYKLTSEGYLPSEIAIWLPNVTNADISFQTRGYAERNRLPIPATCARKLSRRPVPTDVDWRAAFRNFSLRVGFALILTRPMLEYLCATADNVKWDRNRYFQLAHGAMPDNFIGTSHALLKRGLIERKKTTILGEPVHKLTPAGILTVEMLKLTGEFKEADEALEKKAQIP